jgi:hypothetical protein
MKLTNIQQDEDLAKVAARLFRGASRDAQAQARRKLEEANPHLAGVKRPPVGTPVVVPEIPRAASGAAAAESDIVGLLLAGARQQLGGLRETIGPRLARQTEELKRTIEFAGSPEVVRLGEKFPELRRRLPAIAQAARERMAEVDKLNAVQAQGLAELESDLDAFLGRPGVQRADRE